MRRRSRIALLIAVGTSLLGSAGASSAAIPVGAVTQLKGRSACLSSGVRGRCHRGRDLTQLEAPFVTPDGRQLYAVEFGGGIRLFDRDPASGALRQRPHPLPACP